MRPVPTLAALWHLRAMSLFTLGPSLGLLLVDRIFGLPPALRWQAGAMGLLMFGLFVVLLLRVRAEYLRARSPTDDSADDSVDGSHPEPSRPDPAIRRTHTTQTQTSDRIPRVP